MRAAAGDRWRLRRRRGGGGDEADPALGGEINPDHLGDRRHRLPDEPAGAQCGRGGGAGGRRRGAASRWSPPRSARSPSAPADAARSAKQPDRGKARQVESGARLVSKTGEVLQSITGERGRGLDAGRPAFPPRPKRRRPASAQVNSAIERDGRRHPAERRHGGGIDGGVRQPCRRGQSPCRPDRRWFPLGRRCPAGTTARSPCRWRCLVSRPAKIAATRRATTNRRGRGR